MTDLLPSSHHHISLPTYIWVHLLHLPSWPCCSCSVTKLCLILHAPMGCSTPGFPVSHHLPEFTQVHAILLVKTKSLLATLSYPIHSIKDIDPAIFPSLFCITNFFSIWSLSSTLKHWNDICYFLLSSIKTLFTAILLLLFPFSYSF